MKKASAVEIFLKKHMLHADEIDTQVHVQNFIRHMENGLQNKESSLAMLATYVKVQKNIAHHENVIVLDAGGTHVRSALIHFDESGAPIIKHYNSSNMPGRQGQVSCQEVFDHFVQQIKDIADKSTKIGFCFSYPTQAMPNHDGKLLFMSKGVDIGDHQDMLVGECLRAALKKEGFDKDYQIIIVNDTLTTLLMGLTVDPKQKYSTYLGAILGTGMNIAYSEYNEAITKISTDAPKDKQVINIEAGEFTGFLTGSLEREFNQKMAPKGRFAFEKTMSGAYLGPLAAHVLSLMCKEDIFDPDFAKQLSAVLERLTTIELCHFLMYPTSQEHILGKLATQALQENKENAQQDTQALYYTCQLLIERAAKLFACAISAVLLKSEAGLSPLEPACIVIDGTTFYALKNFKFLTEYYLKEILKEDNLRYYEIARVESASLLGAAIAALTTFKDND